MDEEKLEYEAGSVGALPMGGHYLISGIPSGTIVTLKDAQVPLITLHDGLKAGDRVMIVGSRPGYYLIQTADAKMLNVSMMLVERPAR